MAIFNLSKRENKILALTIAVVAVWLLQMAVIKPLSVKWRKVDDQLSADRMKLERSERLVGRESDIKKDYEKIAAPLKMTGSPEEEMARFLTEIESLANSAGVRVNEIKPLPHKQWELYRKFYAELELEGEMVQVSGFMKKVQESTSLISIEKLSLGSKQAGTDILRCRIVLSKTVVI